MIKYIWFAMLAAGVIYWLIYTIADTINTFRSPQFRRFIFLEDVSKAFYLKRSNLSIFNGNFLCTVKEFT